MSSKALIPAALAVAALVAVTPAISAPQSSVAAKRYEFSFPANSDKLPSQAPASSELAAAIDLLVHQGRRRELTFVMTGAVSRTCMEWPNCPDRVLLMHRAEHIVDALTDSWPAQVEKGALERLRWEATPSIPERNPDRVQILLRTKSSPGPDNCPARLEVLDPSLPGTVEEPDRPHWIETSAGQPVAISSSTRLRARQDAQAPQSFELWVNLAGQSKQLQPQFDKELGEEVFVVKEFESPFWIAVRRTEDNTTASRALAQREAPQSRIGESVAGFPSTVPGDLPPTPCSFGFQRWSPPD